MPAGSSTYFPSPEASSNPSFWEDFTESTYVASTAIENDRWYDTVPLETDTCASYLVAPADRSGRLICQPHRRPAVSKVDRVCSAVTQFLRT